MLPAIGHLFVVVRIRQHQGAVRGVNVSLGRTHRAFGALNAVAVPRPASVGAIGVWRLLLSSFVHQLLLEKTKALSVESAFVCPVDAQGCVEGDLILALGSVHKP